MKLATYKDGSRDGQLLVVSRDLTMAHYATGIANTLQQALEDWNFMSPQLQDLYDALNQGRARHAFAFDPSQCMAPLPRAYQCLDAAAFTAHHALLHQASGTTLPENWINEPQLCAVDGAYFGAACDPIVAISEQHGIDFSAQISVITGDIAQAASPSEALAGVRLLMLSNGVVLRQMRPINTLNALSFPSRAMTAFSPVAITPDELGDAWQQGRLGLTLQCTWNERKVGMLDAAAEMHFDFGQLLSCAVHTRPLYAGAVVNSGVISQSAELRGEKLHWPKGYATIEAKRSMEQITGARSRTEFMRFGDTIKIETKDKKGLRPFGAIAQTVQPFKNSED